MVALDDDGVPCEVPPLILTTQEEKERFDRRKAVYVRRKAERKAEREANRRDGT